MPKSGYRSYRRKRTTYKRRASTPFKRRMRKRIAKRKAYSYDGIVRHKFVCDFPITALAGGIGESVLI